MSKHSAALEKYGPVPLGLLLLAGLYAISQHNYLLFHSLAELFTVVVAFAAFVIFWNVGRSNENGYFLFVAIACLFVEILDLLHTLSYKGMGVFAGAGANQATQLWIAARYLQALSLFIAPTFAGRPLRYHRAALALAAVTGLIATSILAWDLWPAAYVEGQGLTTFKKASEFIISAILLLSIVRLLRRRRAFGRPVLALLAGSALLTIASEMAFTLYVGVYDWLNLVGHLFKIAAFYLLYVVLVRIGLREPFEILFRDLKRNDEALRRSERQFRSLVEQSLDGIALMDERGGVAEWNLAMESLTGLAAEQVLGRPIWEVQTRLSYEGEYGLGAPDGAMAAVQDALRCGQAPWLGRSSENHFRRADGARRTMESTVFAIPTGEGFMLGNISRDITGRKEIEGRVQASLQEKTVLLQEIHHRVKNNLQIICSLLDMQAQGIEDPYTLQVLQDSRNRVRAMAFVHDRLYQSRDLARIEATDYVAGVLSYLLGIYVQQAAGVDLRLDVAHVALDLDTAIPCGLIINELASNALKHAFPPGRGDNQVWVEIALRGRGRLELIVGDNGTGLPPGIGPDTASTLGLKLVSLLTQQLHGTLELRRDGGSEFHITFGGSADMEDRS